jgi:hypothetical protein
MSSSDEEANGSDGAEAPVNKYALYVKDEIGCSIRRIPDRSTANFQPWRQTAAPTPFQSAVCVELNKLAPDSLPRRLVQAFAESDTFLQAPCEARSRLREALLLAICYFAIPKTAGDELSRKVVVWHDRDSDPPYQALWSKLGAISTFKWECFSRADHFTGKQEAFVLHVDHDECVEFRRIPSTGNFTVDFKAAPVHLFDCERSGARAPNVINYDPNQNRAIVFNHTFDDKDAASTWLTSFGGRGSTDGMRFANCVGLEVLDRYSSARNSHRVHFLNYPPQLVLKNVFEQFPSLPVLFVFDFAQLWTKDAEFSQRLRYRNDHDAWQESFPDVASMRQERTRDNLGDLVKFYGGEAAAITHLKRANGGPRYDVCILKKNNALVEASSDPMVLERYVRGPVIIFNTTVEDISQMIVESLPEAKTGHFDCEKKTLSFHFGDASVPAVTKVVYFHGDSNGSGDDDDDDDDDDLTSHFRRRHEHRQPRPRANRDFRHRRDVSRHTRSWSLRDAVDRVLASQAAEVCEVDSFESQVPTAESLKASVERAIVKYLNTLNIDTLIELMSTLPADSDPLDFFELLEVLHMQENHEHCEVLYDWVRRHFTHECLAEHETRLRKLLPRRYR